MMHTSKQSMVFATRMLLIAVALIGVAQLTFLPPWEGFDEYAHWSSIQQIAETGSIPLYGRDHVSADVDAYPGPMPYTTTPPFDNTGRPTYRSYREMDRASIAETIERSFRQGMELNWQAQHPPLYYGVLAPVYLITKSTTWVTHLFLLRLTSWSLAFTGLAIGVLATQRYLPEKATFAAPFMAAYPFLVPQFFPEMARLGNDSLCLLLMGTIWALLLQSLWPRRHRWSMPLLGLALAAGLLTKAFFVPISFGVLAFLAVRWLHERRPEHLRDLVTCATVAGCIGAAWYLRNLLLFDNLLGTNDFIRLAHGIGLKAGLEQNFSIFAFVRGLAAIFGSYIWAGTWSLAQPPEYLLLATATLVVLTVGRWIATLRPGRFAKAPACFLPLFIVGPVIGGLGYHLLTVIAETGRGAGTPGWYLHILVAPISFAMATGWSLLPWRAGLRALACGSVMLGVLGWGLQLSLFSGCATKSGSNKYYDWTGASCLVDWSQLDALGFPATGFVCLCLGAAAAVGALIAWFRPDAMRTSGLKAPLPHN